MAARALRNIDKLAGASYPAGATIPDDVVAKISPQVLRSLVNGAALEVDGMERGADAGASAHIKARQDQHHERIQKLEAANVEFRASHDDLAKRLATLESGNASAKTARKKG